MLLLQSVSLRRNNVLTFMKAAVKIYLNTGGRGRRRRHNNYLLLDVSSGCKLLARHDTHSLENSNFLDVVVRGIPQPGVCYMA